MGGLGPFKVGRSLIDPHGEVAWLPEGYDESRYAYKEIRVGDWASVSGPSIAMAGPFTQTPCCEKGLL